MIATAQTIPLSAYFPDCILPPAQCTAFFGSDHAQPHQHILPKQLTVLSSTAKFLYMQGGVGGGKSEAFAVKCVQLAVTIPKNRGVVARHNFAELFDSSWRKVNECIDRLVDKEYIPKPVYQRREKGNYTLIKFANGSELQAVHGKNWRQGLGADHGFFWVDDALECMEEFFVGTDVSAGLLSRLRLPHVHFHPATYDEQTREHGSLHGMVSSNPPPYGHWLHRLFGNSEGIHNIGDDQVEWLIGDTTDNPFTGGTYAKSLISVQAKLGHSKDNIRRIIHGESIPAYGGVKVYPQFNHALHVGHFKYHKNIPVIAGWDFGFLHPAVVFSHLYKCKHKNNHYISISEVADAHSVNIYDLYQGFVLPHIKACGYDKGTLLHAGDRAGYRASSSNRDRRGDMKILKDEYSIPFRFRFLDLENSLQYMRGLLSPKKLCSCGMQYILIDQLNCPVLIGALEGGYKYSKSRDGVIGNKPVEDRFFADIACAWRYGAENYVKWGLPYDITLSDTEEEPKPQGISSFNGKPWGWMEMDDKAIAALLT